MCNYAWQVIRSLKVQTGTMNDVSCSPEGISIGLGSPESTYRLSACKVPCMTSHPLGACKAGTHFCSLGKQAERAERSHRRDNGREETAKDSAGAGVVRQVKRDKGGAFLEDREMANGQQARVGGSWDTQRTTCLRRPCREGSE